MKDKVVSLEQAMEQLHDGMTVAIPGFVNCGVPQTLIQGILDKGCKNLKILSNNTSVKGKGIGKLVHAGVIEHITCTHIGSNTETVEKVVNGELEVTFSPQGTFCERIRAGGAGIGGVLTPTGVGTPMEEGKQLLEWDDEKGEFKFVKSDEPRKGKRFILELPLRAEVAIVHAYKADRAGNAIYHRTARNFNQIIATCADTVILEAEEIVEVGELDPDIIMTPGMLVDMIVQARKEDADA